MGRAEDPALAHIGDGDAAEIEVDLVAQFLPQVMGQAAAAVGPAPGGRAGGAAGGADRLVHRQDDIGDPHRIGGVGPQKSPPRAPPPLYPTPPSPAGGKNPPRNTTEVSPAPPIRRRGP